MSEGSRVLQVTIAGILGVVIVRNLIDEQIPSCILAMPPKPAAMTSCPAQHFTLHLDRDNDLFALMPPIGQLTGVSHGVSLFNGQLTDATPCVASAADCPEKEKVLHLERKDLEPNLVIPLPLQAAADFTDSQYVPERRDFIQPDQVSSMIVLKPPCPDKEKAPLHLEPAEGGQLITGTGNLAAGPSTITSGPLPPFISNRAQFVENPDPVFIPARRSNLVTVLTQYPQVPKAA
jgi:hypothetical protein